MKEKTIKEIRSISLVEEYNWHRKITPEKKELFDLIDSLRETKAKFNWDSLATEVQEEITHGWLVIIQKYPKLK